MTAAPAAIVSAGRMFPVLQAGAAMWRKRMAAGEKLPPWPRAVPWGLVAPHARQAAANHDGQTLEQLAARGGLDVRELLAVLQDRPFYNARDVPMAAALLALHAANDAWMEVSDG